MVTDIQVSLTERGIAFVAGETEVGLYVVDDPFKPHLHPLRTIKGHVVTLTQPHDHPHHKGLMYALATDDINFWEESPSSHFPVIGKQQQESLSIDPAGQALRQRLIWTAVDGSQPSFQEDRMIACSADATGIRWTWTTQLTALLGLTLRQSPWAETAKDASQISYHGLGIRFPRSFGGLSTRTELRVDNERTEFADALGQTATSVSLTDTLDGAWPPHEVSIRITQRDTRDAFFTLRDPFSFISVGPSNAHRRTLEQGEVISAAYDIDILDGSIS